MPQNLPPILPGSSSSSKPASGISRAQDLSVTKLQQKKDRESAVVSTSQAIRRTQTGRPITSVSRIGREEAKTSISRPDREVRSIYDSAEQQIGDDYRRHGHIRRLIKERQQAAVEEKKRVEEESKGFFIGTGKRYRKTGPSTLKKKLRRMVRKDPAQYRNISLKDREKFEDIVDTSLKHKRTGTRINRKDRIKMRRKAFKSWKGGEISKQDYKDFKKLIYRLE